MEIKLQNIDYSYKKVNYKEKKILENLNINFKSKKINTIIGKNGCGKSTILELLNFNIIPTNGLIKLPSFTVSSETKIQDVNQGNVKIGYLSQNSNEQLLGFTVRRELEMAAKFYNYKVNQLDKRISDVLIMVGLDSYLLDLPSKNLSFSEKRKLLLAIALIHNPEILILDEPTIGLDVKSKTQLAKLLKILKTRYNKTIIIASNDIDFIHKITDYIFIVNDKKVLLEGEKYEIFKQVKKLKQYGIDSPKVIKFSDTVLNKKNIKIGYRDEINDLIKDIYRYVK